MSESPKLYSSLAPWWALVSAPEEYEEEADYYRSLLESACAGPMKTVLELGSGGGNNAWHMKQSVRMTLVDFSEEMLAVSRRLNPECEHLNGDMRSLRLHRTFDAVFVHDAVAYMTTEDDLRAAMMTAYVHCRGVVPPCSLPTISPTHSNRRSTTAVTMGRDAPSDTSSGHGIPILPTRSTRSTSRSYSGPKTAG